MKKAEPDKPKSLIDIANDAIRRNEYTGFLATVDTDIREQIIEVARILLKNPKKRQVVVSALQAAGVKITDTDQMRRIERQVKKMEERGAI